MKFFTHLLLATMAMACCIATATAQEKGKKGPIPKLTSVAIKSEQQSVPQNSPGRIVHAPLLSAGLESVG